MNKRGLSNNFLNAMRKGLEKGRCRGYRGWDQKWENCVFPYDPIQFLVDRLNREKDELIIAIKIKPESVFREAADVANFAMMIADICREDQND